MNETQTDNAVVTSFTQCETSGGGAIKSRDRQPVVTSGRPLRRPRGVETCAGCLLRRKNTFSPQIAWHCRNRVIERGVNFAKFFPSELFSLRLQKQVRMLTHLGCIRDSSALILSLYPRLCKHESAATTMARCLSQMLLAFAGLRASQSAAQMLEGAVETDILAQGASDVEAKFTLSGMAASRVRSVFLPELDQNSACASALRKTSSHCTPKRPAPSPHNQNLFGRKSFYTFQTLAQRTASDNFGPMTRLCSSGPNTTQRQLRARKRCAATLASRRYSWFLDVAFPRRVQSTRRTVPQP